VSPVSEFVTVLRTRVRGVQQALSSAREVGHDFEIDLHVARLRELLDLAERNGVDTAGWVAPLALSTVPYQD
jgi:hypothetical protein